MLDRRSVVLKVLRSRAQSARPSYLQRRFLSIHEYQSQALLRDADILVPKGYLARTAEEASAASRSLGGECVLKSQILAGGRGKGHFDSGLQSGIHVVADPGEAANKAAEMLGHHLHTKQTVSQGILVDKLYVTEKVKYSKEYYLSITIDRNKYCPVIIASSAGGTSIEETAKNDPNAITRVHLDYERGIDNAAVKRVAEGLGVSDPALQNKLQTLLQRLFDLFKAKDSTLVEINPLVLTNDNEFLCLDAKFNFDNAAKQRQPDLFALEEKSAREGAELEAEKSGLVYIRLDGNIGNVVNGAGLAMATNDAIELFGGKSANFLDAGGQATKETMVNAFRIILGDERVKVILVNIYGGIIRCDMIAASIIAAAEELAPLRVPLVVRLKGTNAELGQKMLKECGYQFHTADGFGEAAQLAVELSKSDR